VVVSAVFIHSIIQIFTPSDLLVPSLGRSLRFSTLCFTRRSNGSTLSTSTICERLLLFRWFENLYKELVVSDHRRETKIEEGLTWKEQRRVSSTLIIAPALSNSPQ